MVQFLKKHYGIIIVAAFVGLIYFLPDISFDAARYIRIANQPLNFEEAFSYGARVREVMDGHFADGDPYLVEHKGQFTTWDYYPLSLLTGSWAKLFGINNPETLFIWFDLFLPPATILIIYALFYAICRKRSWSALAALIFVTFPNIIIYKNFFSPALYQNHFFSSALALLKQGFNPDFSRLFVPNLTMIFFSLWLLLMIYLLQSSALRRRWLLFTGLAYGALFYVYFYYWVFATIALGLAVIISFFCERGLIRRFLAVMVIGWVMAIPYWTRYWLAIKNPLFHEYIARVGLDYSHQPAIGSLTHVLLIVALIIIFWHLRKKIGWPIIIWAGATLLATIAVLNIQVILGFNPQPDHWGSRVNIYILMIWLLTAIFFVAKFLLNKKNNEQVDNWLVRISLVALAFFLIVALIAQADNIAIYKSSYLLQDDARQALGWIDQQVPPDSVIVTPSVKTRMLIPYLTQANSYLPMACMSLASKQEIIDRYLDIYALFKVPRELFISSLNGDIAKLPSELHYLNTNYPEEIDSRKSIFCDEYNYRYNTSMAVFDRRIPNEVIVSLLNGFDAKKLRRFADLPWRADYVFFGPGEKLISKLKPENNPELSLVYQNATVKIFKIIKSMVK